MRAQSGMIAECIPKTDRIRSFGQFATDPVPDSGARSGCSRSCSRYRSRSSCSEEPALWQSWARFSPRFSRYSTCPAPRRSSSWRRCSSVPIRRSRWWVNSVSRFARSRSWRSWSSRRTISSSRSPSSAPPGAERPAWSSFASSWRSSRPTHW